MFNRMIIVGLGAAVLASSAPAIAQSGAETARFQAAQDRFDREYQIYRQEADRYRSASINGDRGGRHGNPYRPAADPRYQDQGFADDRAENGYDPQRYYRAGPNYQERTLSADDRVYAGNDGRYYCKRSDGTTGLIVGAAGGGILGNVIDGGHSRTVGTLLGAAIGGLAGRAVDQNNSQVRCR